MTKPRVLLADDHRIVAAGLEALLAPDYELAGRAGLECAPRVRGFGVHGQEHHRHLEALAPHLLQRLDAVQPGHRDVRDHEIRRCRAHQLDQRASVLGASDQLVRRRQQRLEPRRDDPVVVRDQHTWLGHSVPRSGIQAVTRVP